MNRASPKPPEEPSPGRKPGSFREGLGVASLAAIATLGLFTWTLSPGLTGEDSGELIAAAYNLGIAHPPGYPLWCLLAKATGTLLSPFASFAWSVNFFSALCGALTSFFIVLVARSCGLSRPGSLIAGLLVAVSQDFWSQAVIAEVYTLNSMFVAAGLWVALRWKATFDPRWPAYFALLWGLSLTNHQLMGPVGFCIALWMILVAVSGNRDRSEPQSRSLLFRLGVIGGLFLVGLLPINYLWIRSSADPYPDWGNPETLSAFLEHVRREQYGFKSEQVEWTAGLFMRQLGTVAEYARTQWGLLHFLIPIGMVLALFRARASSWLLLAVFLLLTVALTVFLNFSLEREDVVTGRAFFISAWAIGALWIAWTFDALWRHTKLEAKGARAGLALAGAAMVVSPAILYWERDDRSSDYLVHDYGRALMDTLEPEAIFFPASDHSTFPLFYFQAVHGERLDITIANKYGSLEEEFYADMPEDLKAEVERRGDEIAKEDWVIRREFTKRPLYFVKKRWINVKGLTMKPQGLLYRVCRQEDPDPEAAHLWESYQIRGLDTEVSRLDYSGFMVLSDYFFARGRYLLAEGEHQEADRALDRMGELCYGLKQSLNNIGSVYAEHRRFDRALTFFKKSLDVDPAYPMALNNATRVLETTGQLADAAAYLDRLVQLNPEDVALRLRWARSLASSDLNERAKDVYLDVLVRAPEDPGVLREVGTFLLYRLGEKEHAKDLLQSSLHHNPEQPKLKEILTALEHGLPLPSSRSAEDPFPGVPNRSGFPGAPGIPDPRARMPRVPSPWDSLPDPLRRTR